MTSMLRVGGWFARRGTSVAAWPQRRQTPAAAGLRPRLLAATLGVAGRRRDGRRRRPGRGRRLRRRSGDRRHDHRLRHDRRRPSRRAACQTRVRASRRRWPPPTGSAPISSSSCRPRWCTARSPNNPVPLTEDAVLRPDPSSCTPASSPRPRNWSTGGGEPAPATVADAAPGGADRGRRHVVARRRARPGRPAVRGGRPAERSSSTTTTSRRRSSLAVRRRLDDVYNVAPDGSIPGERVRALTGQRFRFPMPGVSSDVVGACGGGSSGVRSRPVCVRTPESRGSWRTTAACCRVGADGHQRAGLRRRGPRRKWWTMVTPKRRQELALGAVVGAALRRRPRLDVTGRRWWRRRARR